MADKLTTEKKLEVIQQISALADGVTLEYVKGLSEIVCNPETDPEERQNAYREMDKVLRISKQYSDRLLLAEGKTTANIGIDGKGGLPFKFVINKHYPEQLGDKCESDKCESDQEDSDD